jgi:hypothetical protein
MRGTDEPIGELGSEAFCERKRRRIFGKGSRFRQAGMLKAKGRRLEMLARALLVMMMAVLMAVSPPGCPEGRRLFVLVDQSGSMIRDFDREGLRWTFVKALLAELREAPGRVSIFAFGDRLEPLVEDVPLSVAQAPKEASYLGGTDLVGALQAAAARPDAACSVWVLATDGVPQTDSKPDPRDHQVPLQKAVREIRTRGIPVAVALIAPPGIEDWKYFQQMRELWEMLADEDPGLRVFEIQNAEDAAAAARSVAGELAKWIAPPPVPSPTPSPTPTATPRPPEPMVGELRPAPPPTPQRRSGWDPRTAAPIVVGIVTGVALALHLRSRLRPRLIGELVWRTREGLERRRDLSRYRGAVDLGKAIGERSLEGVARLEARKDPKAARGRTVYLIPLRDGRVRCGGVPVREPMRLHDRDEIDLGDFRVRFENLFERMGRSAWPM